MQDRFFTRLLGSTSPAIPYREWSLRLQSLENCNFIEDITPFLLKMLLVLDIYPNLRKEYSFCIIQGNSATFLAYIPNPP